jgi:hypothetical protein
VADWLHTEPKGRFFNVRRGSRRFEFFAAPESPMAAAKSAVWFRCYLAGNTR